LSASSTPRSSREDKLPIYSNSIIPQLSFADISTALSQNTPRTARSLNSARSQNSTRKNDSVQQITPRLVS
jgi:hypothetical protein